MKRYVTEVDNTGKSTTVTMPEYVSRICSENTLQQEQIAEYKDFVRDVCHTLGMSLESTFADVLRRVEKLKVAPPSVPSETGVVGAESGLYSVATVEDWAERCSRLNDKLTVAEKVISAQSAKLKESEEYHKFLVDSAGDALKFSDGYITREIRLSGQLRDCSAKCNDLSVKLLSAQDQIAELSDKLNTSAWAVQGRNELLEEYRQDNAALNRQVEEYRAVAFGLWDSLEKARAVPEPEVMSRAEMRAQQRIKEMEEKQNAPLFPGDWVEV